MRESRTREVEQTNIFTAVLRDGSPPLRNAYSADEERGVFGTAGSWPAKRGCEDENVNVV